MRGRPLQQPYRQARRSNSAPIPKAEEYKRCDERCLSSPRCIGARGSGVRKGRALQSRLVGPREAHTVHSTGRAINLNFGEFRLPGSNPLVSNTLATIKGI
jgi:hypothetical protein